jgi:hypothetical protein
LPRIDHAENAGSAGVTAAAIDDLGQGRRHACSDCAAAFLQRFQSGMDGLWDRRADEEIADFWTERGKLRPTAFATRPSSGFELFALERDKTSAWRAHT